MMIHEVNHGITGVKTRKRVGRGVGSGLGKTSGRGHKGAGSRSGYKRMLGFEGGQMPLMSKVAKRGFNNNFFAKKFSEVNLSDLCKFPAGSEVTPELLEAKGIVTLNRCGVKVLAGGSIDRKLVIHAHRFSKAAEIALTNAGCQMVQIDPAEQK